VPNVQEPGSDATASTSNGSPTASRPQGQRASWFKRLFGAQESGLVLVIIAMAVILTIRGGSKAQPEIFEVSPTATVTQTSTGFTVTEAGDSGGQQFPSAEGWFMRELGRRPVMKTEGGEIVRLERCDQLVEEKDASGKVLAWLKTTEDGTARRFVAAEGWSTGFVPERKVIQRDYVEFIPVPAGTQVEVRTQIEDGTERTASFVMGGATYAVSDGWDFDRSSQTLRRQARVNKFLDLSNLVLLAKDASFIAVMAVGMTAIIILGGIDLSVGSIYAFAALLGALTLRYLQANALGVAADNSVATICGVAWYVAVPVALLVCCSVGAACGAISGTMVVGLRVHPFIITLGMMAVLRGIVFITTKGQAVLGVPNSFVDGFFKAEILGVNPVPVFIMLVVAVAGFIVLTRTVLGRRIYAIGGNEIAAKYAGIPVGKVKIIVFTLSGLLVGLSACMSLGYFGSASPEAGKGYELDVIAAAVIGGASLSGGRGTALGAVLGAILIQMIRNAMLILDIDTNYTEIVMGAAIVAAVVLDQAKTRFTTRKS
jgi:ribose/xylose/arabinose/galactoside ABC-type transport system permease subunit